MATEVVIPMLGITVERGRIIEWAKKEGEQVKKGETLFIVETEKVTTEVESPVSGILAKILVPEGVEVPVLTVVGIITEPGEALPDKYRDMTVSSDMAETTAAQNAPERKEQVRAVPAARRLAKEKGIDINALAGSGPDGIVLLKDVEAALEGQKTSDVKATFLASKVAREHDIPLEQVQGTGVHGRITREDVQRVIEGKKTPVEGEVIPFDSMRRAIARRMCESAFTAPHVYFFTDVCMDAVAELRLGIIPELEKNFGLRPSVNDILIKAVALNLREFPMLNATLKGEEIHIFPQINIGLAVALPAGLIVPAIANADRIGLVDIIRQRRELVEKARNGNLSMAEIERGTFTISSLAQYDITYFTAILNPPQSGILSVGKTRKELFMVDGQVRERKVATLGLSVDHRIVDGAVAADFLQHLKWRLERPFNMFFPF